MMAEEINLYDEMVRASDNIPNIQFMKYGVITYKTNQSLCNVKEINSDLEHINVPILNNTDLSVGDKVIICFVENSLYDPVVLGKI